MVLDPHLILEIVCLAGIRFIENVENFKICRYNFLVKIGQITNFAKLCFSSLVSESFSL